MLLMQRVLQLSAADVYRFADNKQDADTLLESIQSLRETGVSNCKASLCCFMHMRFVNLDRIAQPQSHVKALSLCP